MLGPQEGVSMRDDVNRARVWEHGLSKSKHLLILP